MVAEPTTATYTDEALSAIIDAEASVEGAAVVVWQEKAAKYAALVNTSESGSSRSNSQLHQNALNMAKFYENRLPSDEAVTPTRPFSVPVERA